MTISQHVDDQFIYDLMKSLQGGADVYEYGAAGVCRELEELGLCDIVEAQNSPEDVKKKQPYFGAILTLEGVDVMQHINPNRPVSKTQALLNRAEGVTRLICETYNLNLGKNQRADIASLIFIAMTSPVEL